MNRLKMLARIDREWGTCIRCPLGKEAFRHVLYELPEGETRADILFVGEAPGRSEDVIGQPFIGRAGKLLRETIETANPEGLVIAYSNLLACRPSGVDGKDRPPKANEVSACHGRLVSLLQTLEPWAVVALGAVPKTYLPPIIEESGWNGELVSLYHPSYIGCNGGKSAVQYSKWLAGFEELFDTVRRFKSISVPKVRDGCDRYAKYPALARR